MKYARFLLTIIIVMLFSSAKSQQQTETVTNEWGIPRMYIPKDATTTAMTTEQFFSNILNVKGDDSFVCHNVLAKEEHRRHDLYEQYYKGIKVAGCGYVVHYKDGFVSYAHGSYIPIKDIDVKPTISEASAIRILSLSDNSFPTSSQNYEVSLVVLPPKLSEKNVEEHARLAYYVALPPTGKVGLVDAHTGEIVYVASTVSCFSATGTLHTYYSGTKQAKTQYYGNQYHLVDSTTSAVIHTWNLNGSSSVENKIELSDADNNWTLNLNQTNRLFLAHDVYWGTHATYDYIYSHHGRNSFDDAGCDINSYINNNETDNACWNRLERSLKFPMYNLSYKPLVSLDVVAHEYGHGITSDMIGWDDPLFLATISFEKALEAAACNEGLSDVWSAIVEAGVKGTTNMWKVAEECMFNYSQSCLRNIETPNDPNASSVIADTYKSTTYYSCEEHGKGGVFSRWFYLLVNGGTATNALGRSYQVIGIGLDDAEQFLVDAIYEHALYHAEGFEDVRDKLYQFALSNYSSFVALQVANAWYAVGVGTKPSQISISGSSTLCSSNSYFVSGLPSCYTVTWSLTGGNTSSVSLSPNTPSANQCTLSVSNLNTFNSVTLTAEIKLFGTTVGTISKQITKSAGFSGTYEETSGYYNGYNYPAISQQPIDYPNPTNVYIGGVVTLRSNYFTGKNISTSGPYQNYQFTGGNVINFALCPWNVNQPFTIIVQEQGCDDEVQLTFNAVTYPSYAFQLNITPQGDNSFELRLFNADGVEDEETAVLNLESRQGQDADAQKNLSWNLEVTNATTGRKAASISLKEPTYLLDATGWETGIYIVRALVGEESLTGKITVK